jgi:3-hydroxyacyl-[acyl-carrier-protein] dehydratase
MFLATIEEARFRRPVVPGDQLRIEMKLLRLKYTVAKMQGTATVDGQVVAEATLMCKLILPTPEPKSEGDKPAEAPAP